jgi:hypothetical protein
MTEFNLDDAIAVRVEEAREDARVEAREEAIVETREGIIRNSFANGLPIDIICKITGLDINTVQTLGTAK